jgi:phage tail-like protein
MSTAGPTHLLLDRRAGWRAEPELVTGVELDQGVLRLTPLPGAPQPLTDPSGTFGGLADPIGVAAGPDGTIVILDHGGDRVLRYDPCDGRFAPLPCLFEPGAGSSLSGARDLAITRAGDVAIADTGQQRVLVLVGAGLAVRAVSGPRTWPGGTWDPWGIAAWRGGLVVSDHTNGLVHFLDGCGRWRHSTDGAGPGVSPLSLPAAITVDRDGNVYVLQDSSTHIRVLDPAGAFSAELDTLESIREDFCPVAVAMSPTGQLCVAGAGGELCLIAATGADAPVGQTTIDAPIAGLSFDRDGNPVLIDSSQCCVVQMRNGAGYPVSGTFVTTALDSGIDGCRWHRVALRASVPEGTAIAVNTLTAQAPLSPAEVIDVAPGRWATGQVAATVTDGGWDCLVRSDPGRYAWLRLTLTGDGTATPEVDDAEVWFPRRTSADYLPRAFKTEPNSGDFLERYMAIFDRERTTVTDEIDRVAALLDPMAAPARSDGAPDFLSWLAGWVGMAFAERLPIHRRRLLVRDAAQLFRLRGTPEGVRRFVSLFCDVEVRVLEHYRLRRWAIIGRGRLGDTTQLFGPAVVKRLQLGDYSEIGSFELIDTDDPRRDPFMVYASRFSLFLLAHAEDRLLARAQRVAELAKPAHTLVDIEAIEPRQRVGIQSTIGLDTVVGELPPPGRTGEARLGQGVIVGPDPRLGGRALAQVGLRAQIGVNTGLE